MKILAVLLTMLYPFIVYFGLTEFSVKEVSILLIVVLGLRFVFTVKRERRSARVVAILAIVLLTFSLVFEQAIGLLFYPVVVNLSLALIFTASIINPPTAIERLARIQEPNLSPFAVQYTATVTKVWVGFFILNGTIACYTALANDIALWTLYNGCISYMLMGLLFTVEYLIRQRVKKLDV